MGSSAKSIVLFSDGTGNSSAKLFKTNVWRMYEAVDLGPSPAGDRNQISFYDDGVGTSGFKALAALGGAFGWGLKRNVLELYRYACRNYRDGDSIYAFGFSRGAFTIRLVVEFIASQGLVKSDDESDLDHKSRRAYRVFRSQFTPRKLQWPTIALRRLRDKWADRRDRRKGITPYNREENRHPRIRFVGVWDTVAAYGGPISEITRAIDNWIYSLSMPDYELNERVECARHALSIDDQRDAFLPLLWDEHAEARRADDAKIAKETALAAAEAAGKGGREKERERLLAEARNQARIERRYRTRLEQVWFTGMHADVGGGYPDESLSYVSLLWMMEEAENAGLRTLAAIKDRYFALANCYGPMHDSRAGIAAYYRYQPRKIASWVHPPDPRYLQLRYPDVRHAGKEHGLLCNVRVHESVIARINSGTVRYAPISLPAKFDVIPPQLKGEAIEQATSANAAKSNITQTAESKPLVSSTVRRRIDRGNSERADCHENLWDFVWGRRAVYFATIAVTLLLVVLPFWNPISFVDRACSDSRCVMPSLIRSMDKVAPGFTTPWIRGFAQFPFSAILLIIAIFVLLRWGRSIERRLSDKSYHLWRGLLEGQAASDEQCRKTPLRRFRESKGNQGTIWALKWYVLPAAFGLLMLSVILYIPLVALAQASIQYEEASHYFCAPEKPSALTPLTKTELTFDTSKLCQATAKVVEKGTMYDVVFQLPLDPNGEPLPWWDADVASAPDALTRVRAKSFGQVLGMPMRRVIEASYLQPLAQITTVGAQAEAKRGWLPDWLRSRLPHLSRVYVSRLELERDPVWPELYRARFRAERDGSLHLFANDAQLPFGYGRGLYANNCGVAQVTITKILPPPRGQPRSRTSWRARRQLLAREPGAPVEIPECARPRLKALATGALRTQH